MHFIPSISRKFSNLGLSDFSSFINSKIRAFVQQGNYPEALQLYSRKPHSPLKTSKFTFPSLLKSCAALSSHHHGKAIHATILTLGLQSDPYVATSLINMYVKCGSLSNAVQVFVTISESEGSVEDPTVWNSIIDGYFRYGLVKDGVVQFRRMQSFGVRPDAFSLSILLGICNNSSCLLHGKQIHAYIIRNVFEKEPFLETTLIDMYAKCSRTIEAWKVFEKLGDKSNAVAWNAMIGGFCENELWEKSLELFAFMKHENCKLGSATFSSVLTACACGEDVISGKVVHCDVLKMGFEWDPYVCTSLLTMYAKCRLVEDARQLFDQIPDKEIELWNSMISAYVGNGCAHEALDVYYRMRLFGFPSDCFTMSNILSVCSMAGSHDFGRAVHGELVKRPVQGNTAVQSALLTMYVKCGSVEDANLVFGAINERDVVAWGSMISGFCQNKKFEEALILFRAMESEGVKPDSTIMASVISACVGLENLELGCRVHGFVIKSGMGSDVFVGSALTDMYAKCGMPEMAGSVFSGMPYKNLVAWNSIISCYCRNGLPELSISLFPQIVLHGLTPDSVSITSVLIAISSVAALLKGKTVHGYQIRLEIKSDLQVENALIDMYIKCGCLNYGQCIFENMPQRNIVTWNLMIAGYGSHGECLKAIRLFDEMRGLGVTPDEFTFLALISSCSHSGLIEEGQRLFQLMGRDYGIEPRIEHYVNMVDLFGRAGRLDEACSFIRGMPIEPDKSVWLCLLGACRAHRNLEIGELAAHNLLKVEPSRGSNYVQLLNLYGEAELWDKTANLRALMKEKGLKKSPGCSWIELRNRVDVFFSGDSSSPRTVEIYETLRILTRNMEGEGEGGHHEGVAL
ncbi:hypothetical protein HHK36_018682 [Tetracentron sinense]|uniref:Chlororespiratory reduction 21 n=1 Tax=Tetracentron sinense TaxID=13715 RepID=A0A834YWC9_TETSI|nr:hypothetical protein HHK36_018682 [Tetracentron sinense]